LPSQRLAGLQWALLMRLRSASAVLMTAHLADGRPLLPTTMVPMCVIQMATKYTLFIEAKQAQDDALCK
jgi:hypothetical protein